MSAHLRSLSFWILLLIIALPQIGRAADWMVIAPARYAAEFQPLAELRAAEGLTTAIVPLELIDAQEATEGDPPARLRAFLRAAHATGTRYVLLGGDATVVPAREVISLQAVATSDLYLVCFDSEWDTDGDGIYDDISPNTDVVPELAIGRAPVRNADEAHVFVAKVLAWEADAAQPYRHRALFMDTVAFPTFWEPGDPIQMDFAEHAQAELLPHFAALDVTRLYQNDLAYPGAKHLSTAAMAASVAAGEYGLVQLACRGGEGAWALDWHADSGYDLLGREMLKDMATGGHGCFLQALTPDGATHAREVGLLVPLMRSPAGGAVGGVGFAGLPYVTTPLSLQREFWALAIDESACAGDAWAGSLAALGSGERWSAAIFTLLGDPALTLVGGDSPARGSLGPQLVAAPNPFNPATTLVFHLAAAGAVQLEIFDLRGRRVAAVLDEVLAAGQHRVTWNGQDDSGRAVAAGVYGARLTSATGSSTRRLVLVK